MSPARFSEDPGIADWASRLGIKRWVYHAAVAFRHLGGQRYSMDPTMLNMAIPKLSADLHPSSVHHPWITAI